MRTFLGVVITAVWLAGLAFIFLRKGGLGGLLALPLNEIGDFLAGAFAPLAFIWFVIAYAQQGEELRQNTAALSAQYEEMKKAAEQATIQADALGQEALSRFSSLIQSDVQFTALRLSEHVRKRMQDPAIRTAIKGSRTAYFAGDREAPVRRMIVAIRDNGLNVMSVIREDSAASAAAKRIIDNFEQLIGEAKSVDNERQALLRFYERSLYGELYNALCLALRIERTFETRKFLTDFSQLTV